MEYNSDLDRLNSVLFFTPVFTVLFHKEYSSNECRSFQKLRRNFYKIALVQTFKSGDWIIAFDDIVYFGIKETQFHRDTGA